MIKIVCGVSMIPLLLTACAWKSVPGSGLAVVPTVVESPLPLPPSECLSDHKAFPVVKKGDGAAVITPTEIVGLWRAAGKRYTYLKHDHSICKEWAKVMQELAKRRKHPTT